jgi:hypothetical protein
VRALHELDVTSSLPVATILAFAVVAIIAGTLAAGPPAAAAYAMGGPGSASATRGE